ncbi:MAG TPA: NADH-quinone oxidoreductase subunit H, partial [Acidobacteriaceae bacterium]
MILTPVQQADQIFVLLQHRLVSYLPVEFQSIADVIISVIAIVLVFAFLFAVTTVLERKGLGRIQNRYGPNRVGPAGFFQPLADGVKSLTKEDLVPRTADQMVHFMAPVLLVIAA